MGERLGQCWGLLSSVPIKTGKELGMKESYDEGLANDTGPEFISQWILQPD